MFRAAIDQSLIEICELCADFLDIALSHKYYKKRWMVTSNRIEHYLTIFYKLNLTNNPKYNGDSTLAKYYKIPGLIIILNTIKECL